MSVRKKWKIQRALGLELRGLGKPGALEKRNYPPGQHGNARKPKVSQFRAQLREKQKLIFHYGIREEQVRRFVRKAKRLQPRNWIEALVGLLERRAALSPRFKSHPVRLQYEPGCGVLRQTWRVMER